jgi:hypothetical protein
MIQVGRPRSSRLEFMYLQASSLSWSHLDLSWEILYNPKWAWRIRSHGKENRTIIFTEFSLCAIRYARVFTPLSLLILRTFLWVSTTFPTGR